MIHLSGYFLRPTQDNMAVKTEMREIDSSNQHGTGRMIEAMDGEMSESGEKVDKAIVSLTAKLLAA